MDSSESAGETRPALATTILSVRHLEDPEQEGDMLAAVHRLSGAERAWMEGDDLHVVHDASRCSREELIDTLERRGFPLRRDADGAPIAQTIQAGGAPAADAQSFAQEKPLAEGDPADALALMPYGVFVLTVSHQDELNSSTVSWVIQVSFEPPLLALALEHGSHSPSMLEPGGTFAINLLDNGQVSVASRQALPHRLRPRNMAGVMHHRTGRGTPVLDEAFAFLECAVRGQLEPGGDHTLFIGEIIGGGVRRDATAMTLRDSGLKYR